MSQVSRQPSFVLLFAVAWLLIVAQLLGSDWSDTARALGDTDDAMRLAQLRDWLSGQGWFDLSQRHVSGGYVSHWSRLIDAGLAGLLWLFGSFADAAMAERLMRTVWPLLWLVPTMAGTVAIAWRIGGREAALVTLLLAAIGLPGFHQFRPGRIDHHNVQIALSMLVVAATVWADRTRWAALAAGALTGLAMAIGLECLPYLIVCAAAFALRHAVDVESAQAAREYGIALAVSSLAGLLVIAGPAHWSRAACDEIAVNWVALTAIGGAGLALAATVASPRVSMRCMQVAIIGTLAIALFVWIEPRCLRGPYAMMDPDVWPIWLAHVREMKPLVRLIIESPITGIGIGTFPLVGLGAVLVLAQTKRFDFGFLVAAAALLASVATMLASIKGAAYATWLAMPLVAAFALHLFALLRLQSLVPRFALGIFLTPAVLSFGATTIANAAGLGAPVSAKDGTEGESCFKNESYAALAHLPRGVVATDIDYGPFLLALTPHSVLAAPYHRLSAGIITVHKIFSSPPDEARALLARHRVTYVMTCARPDVGRGEASNLGYQLHQGLVPAWLEPVPVTEPQAFSVYRLKS
ncbi:MAG: hypothetical protein WCE79_02485 [Xanthobacteraceae bacterium]